ncbi:Hypothetical predicted protein [Podarcis lilfordi]|uniref:Uncharacterized protein n=1 Tax=Podarcis lilfordi TaxID=74358 RepID=A0AA35K2F7_9SAUR|nr:Hypothetical predicted protein [Podarcis lilfordi]
MEARITLADNGPGRRCCSYSCRRRGIRHHRFSGGDGLVGGARTRRGCSHCAPLPPRRPGAPPRPQVRLPPLFSPGTRPVLEAWRRGARLPSALPDGSREGRAEVRERAGGDAAANAASAGLPPPSFARG